MVLSTASHGGNVDQKHGASISNTRVLWSAHYCSIVNTPALTVTLLIRSILEKEYNESHLWVTWVSSKRLHEGRKEMESGERSFTGGIPSGEAVGPQMCIFAFLAHEVSGLLCHLLLLLPAASLQAQNMICIRTSRITSQNNPYSL